jgi:DNA (cytosine-5)-methyltransferase 1
MNELALFAGAGGGILASHLLGWRTVCAVERDAYAAQVLAQRQTDGLLPPFPIWSDVRNFDGRRWRGVVDIVSGGFPCQDISGAGPGTGIEGSRSGLWKDMARIIGEVLPSDVYLENSPMLVGRGLALVLGELAEMGYDSEWCLVSAADLGAPHKRDRIWLLARKTEKEAHSLLAHPRRKYGQGLITESARLDHAVMALHGGPLNPSWVEWLMGWPSGWTDLKPLEMARFREWQQQHSTVCIQVNGEATS